MIPDAELAQWRDELLKEDDPMRHEFCAFVEKSCSTTLSGMEDGRLKQLLIERARNEGKRIAITQILHGNKNWPGTALKGNDDGQSRTDRASNRT